MRIHQSQSGIFTQYILGNDYNWYPTVKSAYRALQRRKKNGENIPRRHVFEDSGGIGGAIDVPKKKSRRRSRKKS